jgi:asparagine synthase (glutamine-hydrolysing)
MPGLVGIITKMPRQQAEAELLRMVASLRHQSAYVTGTWIDESLGLYVGWVERRGSFAEWMPLQSDSGKLVLAFSGEDLSAQSRAKYQEERGPAPGENCLSYLVHLADQDPQFPKSLNGRFHGVLADRSQKTVTLFNDRFGMHRVYYHEAKDAFYFGAEAKAILAVRPELRSIDPDGLAEFVSCGCTLENRTLFRNIGVLPPASSWTFQQASVARKGVYFEAKEWEEQSRLEPEPYYQQLRNVFSRILPMYLGGQQQVGISLTGGLDSRMIMSWANAAPQSLPCYSFGGMYRDSQDVAIGRKVARACGQPHQVIRVGEEFLAQFPHYSERTVFLTDGCVEVKHAPDLYVNELAAKIAPVRLTGNYGGEVLRRVRAFKPVDPLPGLFSSELTTGVERAKQTYRRLHQGHPLSFAVFRQAPWHHYGLLSLEESQLSLRSPFLDNEFVKTVFRAPQSALETDDISIRLIADGNQALSRIRTDRGIGGNLPGWQAAVGRAYQEFTFKAEYAYDYGMPQSAVKIDHALAGLHLERLFLGRHKFYHYRVWYRDALANYVREVLLDSRARARPYLQRDVLERVVRQHTEGTYNHTTTIHKLLTLEHIHRLFIDPQ